MSKYVMPPDILKEFKRIFTVNSHLPPLRVLSSLNLPDKEELITFDGIHRMVWDMTSTPIIPEQTPQSAIGEPEPHANDECIQ